MRRRASQSHTQTRLALSCLLRTDVDAFALSLVAVLLEVERGRNAQWVSCPGV